MNKEDVIQFLKEDHMKVVKVIRQLNDKQMTEEVIIRSWTAKDIISHLTAWISEITSSIYQILQNEEPWFVEEKEMPESQFNQKVVKQSKNIPPDEILENWKNPFTAKFSEFNPYPHRNGIETRI